MLTTYFLGDLWGVCTLSPYMDSEIKEYQMKSFFGLNIHLLAQTSSKKSICADSFSSSCADF